MVPYSIPEPAQVAVAQRLARALQAAGGLGHHLGLGVGDLVLDVALDPLLGRHRPEAVARLLGLVCVGDDREELRLHLGESLASSQLGQVYALQERVGGVGAAPAFGHGLDHGGGADAHVARAEDAGPAGLERDGVGGQPGAIGCDAFVARADPREVRSLADGEQDPVAVDYELGSGCRLRPAAAAGVGGAGLHPDELHAGDLVVAVDHHPRRTGLEDHPGAFFDGLVGLAVGRHVLHVAAIDERDVLHSLPDRGPGAVHGREAAADDDHVASLVARVWQAEGGRAQVLQAVDHAVGRLIGDVELVGVVAADGDDRGVEALVAQVVEGEVAAQRLVALDPAAEPPDRLVLGLEDLLLGQAVLGDAVAEHAAGLRVALEHRHVVAGHEQVVGSGHAGRTRADDRHSLAGLGLGLERQRRLDAFALRLQDHVPGVAVAVSDGYRLVHFVAPAVFLAGRGADAAEDRRERDGALEDARRLAELALGVGLEETRDVDVARALVLAGRQAVGVVVAEDQLQVRPPQAPDLLGLGADDHSGLRCP